MRGGWLRGAGLVGLGLILLASPVLAADADGDGLRDGFEQRWGVTDHLDPDSDGDGVVDSAEDPDGDRLGNLGEQRSGTDPSTWDSDGDGKPDGKEDADRDGRTNAREQDQRRLPKGLRPTLGAAYDDRQPDRKRCQTKHRAAKVRTCTFGDAGGGPTVVLVGDSTMTMYLTALKQTAAARGWKLVTMTKASCPAFLGLHGTLQWRIDKGRTCRAWRRNMIDALLADPPDYIIFGHAKYKLRTMKGKVIPGSRVPAEYQRAVKRTLKAMPTASETLVLGLVPHNRLNPVSCLRKHKWNMSKCVTKAVPSANRKLDNAMRTGARLGGGRYATLHDKICSYDPCPVVQGKVLMWRDSVHLTETFARKLRPSIVDMIERKLPGLRP